MSQPLVLLPSVSCPRDAAVAAIELGTFAAEYAPGVARSARASGPPRTRGRACFAENRTTKTRTTRSSPWNRWRRPTSWRSASRSVRERSSASAASGSNRNAAATWTRGGTTRRFGVGGVARRRRRRRVRGESRENSTRTRQSITHARIRRGVRCRRRGGALWRRRRPVATPTATVATPTATATATPPSVGTELDFAAAEISVSVRLDPLGPEYRAVVRRVDVRWTSSRDGRAWFDVGAHSMRVESGGRAVARVNAVGSHPFVRVDGTVCMTDEGEVASNVRVWMCGLETMVTHSVMADAAAFASSVAERRVAEIAPRPAERIFSDSRQRFGRRGATRTSIPLVRGGRRGGRPRGTRIGPRSKTNLVPGRRPSVGDDARRDGSLRSGARRRSYSSTARAPRSPSPWWT